jgi:hypothetical protein
VLVKQQVGRPLFHLNHEVPATVPIDFCVLDFKDLSWAARSPVFREHVEGFFQGGLGGVRHNDGGGAQVAWVGLEIDRKQAGLGVGERFHIYDIPWTGRFLGGRNLRIQRLGHGLGCGARDDRLVLGGFWSYGV